MTNKAPSEMKQSEDRKPLSLRRERVKSLRVQTGLATGGITDTQQGTGAGVSKPGCHNYGSTPISTPVSM